MGNTASNTAVWTMAVRPQSMGLHTMAFCVLFSLVEEMQIPSSFGWHEGKTYQHLEDSRIPSELSGFSQDEGDGKRKGDSSDAIHPHLSLCNTLASICCSTA